MGSHARRPLSERFDDREAISAPTAQPAISKHPQSVESTEEESNFISLYITLQGKKINVISAAIFPYKTENTDQLKKKNDQIFL